MRGTILWMCAVMLGLGLAACSGAQQQHKQLDSNMGYDALYKALKKEEQEFQKARSREDQLQRRQEQLDAAIEPETPEFNPLDETTISISVQEETIHNILYIVARNAGLNLVIEPGISLDNKATVSFEDSQSSLVVEQLLEAYDLAWQVKQNILYVSRFKEQIFDLDFVNVKNKVTSKSGGDIFGGALASAKGGGGSADLSGEFKVDTELSGDVKSDSLYGVITKSVESVLKSGATGANEDSGYYSLDPVAGQLLVRTTPGKIRAIAKMVNNLKAKLSRQVIIDARILEVTLSDDFTLGIDWNWISRRLAFEHPWTVNFMGRSDVATLTRADSALLSVSGKVGDDTVNSAIQAMQTFGGVKTVSNPHIRAKHGQPALFTSGTSQRYVSQINRDTDTNGNITFSTQTSTVFQGVMLGVVAYITDDGKIDMQIYPIKSDVDAASLALVDVTASGDRISLPSVDVKNIITNVRVNNGDVIILGGLISKETGKTDTGVPGLKDIPGLGWMFKTRVQTEAVRELVVIMTIKVVQ